MAEVFRRCEYGQRKREGKVVKIGSCQNRASGIFRVHYRRGTKIMCLCADCAMQKMPNHVAIIVRPKDDEVIYFRDVQRVELLVPFTTDFDSSHAVHETGDKHWVEPAPRPEPYRGAHKYRKVASRDGITPMNMSEYIKSLRRHDDGK